MSETFDLFALRLADSADGNAYALAVYPATGQAEPGEAAAALKTYATIDELCDYLDGMEFGSEPDILILRAALPGSLESAGAKFHIAQINADGARAIGFRV